MTHVKKRPWLTNYIRCCYLNILRREQKMVFLTQMVLVFMHTLRQEHWPNEKYPGNRGVAIAESARW